MVQTADHIFSTASELFRQYGFRRTTVNQICQHAELSRVTFYKHFSNKDELVIAVLKQHIDASNQAYILFERADISLSEKVKLLIEVKTQESRRFKQDLIKELWFDASPAVAEFIQTQAIKQRGQLARMFAIARERGEVRSDLTDEFLFYALGQLETWLHSEEFHQVVPVFEDKISHMLNFFFFGCAVHANESATEQKPNQPNANDISDKQEAK